MWRAGTASSATIHHSQNNRIRVVTPTAKAQWRLETASTTRIYHSRNDKSVLFITASRSLFVLCNRTSTSSHDLASTDQWTAGAARTAVPKASSGMWRDAATTDGSLTTLLKSMMTYGCCGRNRRPRATSVMRPRMPSARCVLQRRGKGSDSWNICRKYIRMERNDASF